MVNSVVPSQISSQRPVLTTDPDTPTPIYPPCKTLRDIRKNQLKLNQTQFAFRVGCRHPQWVSGWENGTRQISKEMRKQVAERLRRKEHCVFPEFFSPCTRLKEYIKLLGLTYSQVALIAGLPKERIKGFISGVESPTDQECKYLTLVFDVRERQRVVDSGVRVDVGQVFPAG